MQPDVLQSWLDSHSETDWPTSTVDELDITQTASVSLDQLAMSCSSMSDCTATDCEHQQCDQSANEQPTWDPAMFHLQQQQPLLQHPGSLNSSHLHTAVADKDTGTRSTDNRDQYHSRLPVCCAATLTKQQASSTCSVGDTDTAKTSHSCQLNSEAHYDTYRGAHSTTADSSLHQISSTSLHAVAGSGSAGQSHWVVLSAPAEQHSEHATGQSGSALTVSNHNGAETVFAVGSSGNGSTCNARLASTRPGKSPFADGSSRHSSLPFSAPTAVVALGSGQHSSQLALSGAERNLSAMLARAASQASAPNATYQQYPGPASHSQPSPGGHLFPTWMIDGLGAHHSLGSRGSQGGLLSQPNGQHQHTAVADTAQHIYQDDQHHVGYPDMHQPCQQVPRSWQQAWQHNQRQQMDMDRRQHHMWDARLVPATQHESRSMPSIPAQVSPRAAWQNQEHAAAMAHDQQYPHQHDRVTGCQSPAVHPHPPYTAHSHPPSPRTAVHLHSMHEQMPMDLGSRHSPLPLDKPTTAVSAVDATHVPAKTAAASGRSYRGQRSPPPLQLPVSHAHGPYVPPLLGSPVSTSILEPMNHRVGPRSPSSSSPVSDPLYKAPPALISPSHKASSIATGATVSKCSAPAAVGNPPEPECKPTTPLIHSPKRRHLSPSMMCVPKTPLVLSISCSPTPLPSISVNGDSHMSVSSPSPPYAYDVRSCQSPKISHTVYVRSISGASICPPSIPGSYSQPRCQSPPIPLADVCVGSACLSPALPTTTIRPSLAVTHAGRQSPSCCASPRPPAQQYAAQPSPRKRWSSHTACVGHGDNGRCSPSYPHSPKPPASSQVSCPSPRTQQVVYQPPEKHSGVMSWAVSPRLAALDKPAPPVMPMQYVWAAAGVPSPSSTSLGCASSHSMDHSKPLSIASAAASCIQHSCWTAARPARHPQPLVLAVPTPEAYCDALGSGLSSSSSQFGRGGSSTLSSRRSVRSPSVSTLGMHPAPPDAAPPACRSPSIAKHLKATSPTAMLHAVEGVRPGLKATPPAAVSAMSLTHKTVQGHTNAQQQQQCSAQMMSVSGLPLLPPPALFGGGCCWDASELLQAANKAGAAVEQTASALDSMPAGPKSAITVGAKSVNTSDNVGFQGLAASAASQSQRKGDVDPCKLAMAIKPTKLTVSVDDTCSQQPECRYPKRSSSQPCKVVHPADSSTSEVELPDGKQCTSISRKPSVPAQRAPEESMLGLFSNLARQESAVLGLIDTVHLGMQVGGENPHGASAAPCTIGRVNSLVLDTVSCSVKSSNEQSTAPSTQNAAGASISFDTSQIDLTSASVPYAPAMWCQQAHGDSLGSVQTVSVRHGASDVGPDACVNGDCKQDAGDAVNDDCRVSKSSRSSSRKQKQDAVRRLGTAQQSDVQRDSSAPRIGVRTALNDIGLDNDQTTNRQQHQKAQHCRQTLQPKQDGAVTDPLTPAITDREHLVSLGITENGASTANPSCESTSFIEGEECVARLVCPGNSAVPSYQLFGPSSSASLGKDAALPCAGVPLLHKYIDYTSRYGFGYLLTTGVVGVLFNDATQMVAVPEHSLVWAVSKGRKAACGDTGLNTSTLSAANQFSGSNSISGDNDRLTTPDGYVCKSSLVLMKVDIGRPHGALYRTVTNVSCSSAFAAQIDNLDDSRRTSSSHSKPPLPNGVLSEPPTSLVKKVGLLKRFAACLLHGRAWSPKASSEVSNWLTDSSF